MALIIYCMGPCGRQMGSLEPHVVKGDKYLCLACGGAAAAPVAESGGAMATITFLKGKGFDTMPFDNLGSVTREKMRESCLDEEIRRGTVLRVSKILYQGVSKKLVMVYYLVTKDLDLYKVFYRDGSNNVRYLCYESHHRIAEQYAKHFRD